MAAPSPSWLVPFRPGMNRYSRLTKGPGSAYYGGMATHVTTGGFTREGWAGLWQRLGVSGDPHEAFSELTRAYAEAHRAYHNARHIAECLVEFEASRELAERPDEVELAIWTHDLVYTPGAPDNERRSAEWTDAILRHGLVPDPTRARVTDLILATEHRTPPPSGDAALLVDIDLSILGRDQPRFDEYDQDIRQEYRMLDDATYRAGRLAVLQGLLARDAIYHTERYRRRFEWQARENLQRAIILLGQPSR